jgi:predicted dehydrogenase
LVGTGTRGAFTHIPVLKEAPSSELIALCDVSEERLRAAAAKCSKPPVTYSDYQKLLANTEINAVIIATPNLFHREMLQAAIQARKHVLCEKPMGVSPADADAMQKMAESASTVVMFGMQYRNNPRHKAMAEAIASGRIGKPRYLVQNCSRGDWNLSPNVWQYADPKLFGGKPMNWRFSHAASGGTLNEFSCHYLDLLHGIVGALPQRITADGGISVYKDGRDTWDHATITMDYGDGVTAVHTLSLFGPGRNDLVVMGDEGIIEQKGEGLVVTTTPRKGGGGGGAKATAGARTQEIKVQQPQTHSADHATLALYEDFLECVKTGKKPEASAARAAAASRTCWLAELASQRRAEVNWSELGAGAAKSARA